MKKIEHISVIINGEHIGTFGRILNAKPVNSNKPPKGILKYLDNIVLGVLIFVFIKEILLNGFI